MSIITSNYHKRQKKCTRILETTTLMTQSFSMKRIESRNKALKRRHKQNDEFSHFKNENE